MCGLLSGCGFFAGKHKLNSGTRFVSGDFKAVPFSWRESQDETRWRLKWDLPTCRNVHSEAQLVTANRTTWGYVCEKSFNSSYQGSWNETVLCRHGPENRGLVAPATRRLLPRFEVSQQPVFYCPDYADTLPNRHRGDIFAGDRDFKSYGSPTWEIGC